MILTTIPFIFEQAFQVVWAGLPTLLVLLLSIAGTASLLRLLQRRVLPAQASWMEICAGGMGILILLCYGIVLLSHFFPFLFPSLSVLLLLKASAGLVVALVLTGRPRLPRFSPVLLLVAVAICLHAILLFAFIFDLSFPLYQDSAIHYAVIEDLKEPLRDPRAYYSLERILSLRYYHYGYHAPLALLTALQGRDGTLQGMLLVGQFLLTVAPLSLGFLARRLTGDARVFLFTTIFAALGWNMPAYAANWGKYPAIAALVVFPLALLWITILRHATPGRRLLAGILATACSLGSILLHSRTVLLFLAAIIAFLLLRLTGIKGGGWWLHRVFLAVEAIVIAFLFANNPELRNAANAYMEGPDMTITAVALLLILFSGIRFPRMQYAVVSFLMVIFIFASVPVPGSLQEHFGPLLLDRPFIQIILHLPLALLAGMGMVGLLSLLERSRRARGSLPVRLAPLVVAALALVPLVAMRVSAGRYIPDPSCVFVGEDDLVALFLMENDLPGDAQVGIAELVPDELDQPVDAGVWITPLTGIRTEKYPYSLDFGSADTHYMLCHHGTTHIYRGSTATGFATADLETMGEWYEPVLSLPTVRLFRVICTDG